MEDRILFQITVEDLQSVAIKGYGRKLSPQEIEKVAAKISGYFHDWHEKVDFAITDILEITKLNTD